MKWKSSYTDTLTYKTLNIQKYFIFYQKQVIRIVNIYLLLNLLLTQLKLN